MMIEKILSGGQPGAARAALDWAIANDLPHSGWCPKGRRVLDGILNTRYELKETETHDPLEAKRRNVRDSDGTLVMTFEPKLHGNSIKAVEFAQELEKPFLHISGQIEDASDKLLAFLAEHEIRVLNVAGSRDSEEIGIYFFTRDIFDEALSKYDPQT